MATEAKKYKLKVLISFDFWRELSSWTAKGFLTMSLHGRKSSSVSSFSYKGTSSIGSGLTLIVSFNFKLLLKDTTSNMVT